MRKFSSWKMSCIILVLCTATPIPSPAQIFTTLYSFTGGTDGAQPHARLVQATDGNLYGTTSEGGTSSNCTGGCGTVFKITPGGALTPLHNFDGTDGAGPYAGLVQATDGNFYGTTEEGGASSNCTGGCGTVFKITPAGVLTTLYSFDGTDGFFPFAGVVQASDGNFYGTTSGGGTSSNCSGRGCGTVFQTTPAGVLTTLYSFSGADGATPVAGLVQGSDGNFYGTTSGGGTSSNCSGGGCGTVFQTTPAGVLTTLHSFSGTDGASPLAALVQASDGNFYGTTEEGGASSNCTGGCGTVFQITPAGVLTTLYSFSGPPFGSRPHAGLVQATDGNFYGTTLSGGGYEGGIIFKMTPAGALTVLIDFIGNLPYAGLVEATDGNFYGTTAGDRPNEVPHGQVFRLMVFPRIAFSPTSWYFGYQAVNQTSAPKTVTVINTGAGPLDINSITPSANFAASSTTTCGNTLAAGARCGVSVTFTPTVLGKVTGTLTFTDNAFNSPQQTVALSGTGAEPATLTPASYTYATQAVGTTSPAKTFTLTNNQSTTLNNIVISTTGDFAAPSTTCTTTLAAKGKCTISVTFTPTATGKRTGQLSVSDSASNNPQTSKLTGTGT